MKPSSLALRIYFIIIIAFSFFSEVTTADLSVERWINNNRFSATTLSFSNNSTINNMKTSTLFKTQGLTAAGFDVASIRLKKDGQMKFKYRLTASAQGDDQLLCRSLTLKVIKDDQFIYSGNINDLTLEIANGDSGIDDYILVLSLDNNNSSLQQKNCQFDLDFKTFRPNQPAGKGFVAETKINNFVTTGNW
jgi:hypothetical protein